MKKGFVFDLDGVITDTAKLHYMAWKDLAAALDIEIDLAFNEQLKGVSRMESLDKILAYGGKKDDFSIAQKETLAEEKNKHYVELLQDLGPQDLLAGFKEFLDAAKEKQVPCVIASASKNAPFILKKLEVFDAFDAIVDPDQLTKGKPDPEIFIRAADTIHIAPEEAVGFEDAQAGIEGIKACGMFAVGVETTEPLYQADLRVKQLSELTVDELLEK
ncbi:beta-phosphoglucomutase/glucose-1-phosphate phosphodismutase [Tetragenococcus halophilus subsp. halophilus]|uniref:beta-phosphoglucomutase n=1 Tax=Tetragenococcus halophilus TaxID=51669 RepID=UPI000CB5B34A|nr:beta-phosphoglucomutase [Tetragenococcus halophilus]MCF1601622.1 beta-phosphoglucomutase [Tetragenococcus halophilus]RQD30942.1 beta-phosphoglucomutase [Tetragenococcus halophilus subsp. halophilus DSM 20339]GBD59795.1 beta-phosphoglucomutase/glucose-1-phosphate phosphodismutase [Tetragenococcus halophilus subsp. halophilus]GBD81083.1 Beta-phosphoglucomutase/glucose-1-phosphate phosphodismutase [Tetragenococcus halophilus subsp. halophilus]GBD81755.1 beta-phosphoglucomutase/glucose-1-phosph